MATGIKSYNGFTLLELLIVIAILAVLASVSFVSLNPGELLKRARDSKRLSELKSLDKALSIYESQSTNPSMGSSSVVYLSLPDTSQTCASYTLPQAPPGYSYNCVTEQNLRKVDSTGWVPVNLSSLTIGSPLSKLPTDPVNDQTYYYSYVQGGSYMLTSLAESGLNKVTEQAITDGGRMPGTFELGTDLSLGPFTRDKGLVGYWTFDEGTGTTAYDYSGQGNNGTKNNGQWLTGTSCKKGGCFGTTIDSILDYVQVIDPASGILDFSDNDSFSYLMWFKDSQNQGTESDQLWKGGYSPNSGYRMLTNTASGGPICQYADSDTAVGADGASTATSVLDGNWHLVVCIMDRVSKKFLIYLDGVYKAADTNLTEGSAKSSAVNPRLGEAWGGAEVNGAVDDVRIYNRALSAEEIQAIYNATR